MDIMTKYVFVSFTFHGLGGDGFFRDDLFSRFSVDIFDSGLFFSFTGDEGVLLLDGNPRLSAEGVPSSADFRVVFNVFRLRCIAVFRSLSLNRRKILVYVKMLTPKVQTTALVLNINAYVVYVVTRYIEDKAIDMNQTTAASKKNRRTLKNSLNFNGDIIATYRSIPRRQILNTEVVHEIKYDM